MNWLTTQEASLFSVLIEKLVVSELVRKFTFFHGSLNWLPCYRVTVLPWHRVTVTPCYRDIVLPWHRVTVTSCYRDTVLPFYRDAVLPWHRVTVTQYYRVTVTHCYRVTVTPCYRVIVTACYRDIVLPWHRVTVLPWHHKPTNCSYRNLFSSIHYTIIRFAVILFFHLSLFHPSDCFPFVSTCTLLNAFRNSHTAVTCSPNHHLCSCHPDYVLWTDRILELT
jgi:hypothetical protein